MTYQFLGIETKNYKFGMIANNTIHLWPQVMPIFDREMPPDSHLPFVFVVICLYLQFGESGDKSVDQKNF